MASIASERKNKSGEEVHYQGVRRTQWGKYVAEIRNPHKRTHIWLGTFDFTIEAAKAYDTAAIDFRGPDKSKTNFPIPKNHNNNVVIQTPATINSSTTTINPPLTMPLPNHVACSTSHIHGLSGSSSSSALTAKVGKNLDLDLNLPPPPMPLANHVTCSTSLNQGHSGSSFSFAVTVESGKKLDVDLNHPPPQEIP